MKKIKKYQRALISVTVAAALTLQGMPVLAAIPEDTADKLEAAQALVQADFASNKDTLKYLLESCLEELGEEDAVASAIKSILALLEGADADSASIEVLLDGILAGEDEDADEQKQADADSENGVGDETGDIPEENTILGQDYASPYNLPLFEVSEFIVSILQDSVLADVPKDWGNNESGRAITSYSPVNASGAVSPTGGTLTVSYFPVDNADAQSAFDEYADSLTGMNAVSDVEAETITLAGVPAAKLNYLMTIGANIFDCEAACIVWEDTMYTFQLMQGNQAQYDFFPTYYEVVNSAEIGDEETIAAAKAEREAELSGEVSQNEAETEAIAESETETVTEMITEEQTESETEAAAEVITEEQTESETEETAEPETETEPATEAVPVTDVAFSGDLETFEYALNGHVYQFPTPVTDIEASDLALDRTAVLSYDLKSEEDTLDGRWSELINTQYTYLDNSMNFEMVGVSNMTGTETTTENGIVSALIDTEGTGLAMTLPGDIYVGAPESSIMAGLPEFAELELGEGAYRGNDLLFGSNVRSDGSNGYLIIANNAPYYSCLTIVCQDGIVTEMELQCLSTLRAEWYFEE